MLLYNILITICLACTLFPELIGKDIKFVDKEGAEVHLDFFKYFLRISPVGVVLEVIDLSEKRKFGLLLVLYKVLHYVNR